MHLHFMTHSGISIWDSGSSDTFNRSQWFIVTNAKMANNDLRYRASDDLCVWFTFKAHRTDEGCSLAPARVTEFYAECAPWFWTHRSFRSNGAAKCPRLTVLAILNFKQTVTFWGDYLHLSVDDGVLLPFCPHSLSRMSSFFKVS